MTTEESGRIEAQSPRTALISPAPIRFVAKPSAVACSAPPLPEWVSPRPNVVTAVGTSSAPTQHTATNEVAAIPAPRSLARPTSQAEAQIAKTIRPGSTSGTSRRLADGWSGAMAGYHRTAADPAQMIASGSPQARADPAGSRQLISA